MSGEALWALLHENNIAVSEDWKAVLTATKYDSISLLAKLDDNDMNEIRDFMRNVYHKLLDGEELKTVYGVYFRKPEIFELTGGQKKCIKEVVVGCDSLLTRLKRKRSFSLEVQQVSFFFAFIFFSSFFKSIPAINKRLFLGQNKDRQQKKCSKKGSIFKCGRRQKNCSPEVSTGKQHP